MDMMSWLYLEVILGMGLIYIVMGVAVYETVVKDILSRRKAQED